jgi:hypothetical protein
VREAAERLGIQPAQLDLLLGRERGWSWDLYAYEEEVATCISLAALRDIARALRVHPAHLLGEDAALPSLMPFGQLHSLLERHIEATNASIAAFGDEVGWGLEPFLMDQNAAWEWNAEELRDVCRGLAVDWRAVLAWLPGGV